MIPLKNSLVQVEERVGWYRATLVLTLDLRHSCRETGKVSLPVHKMGDNKVTFLVEVM